jgi:hypothetical protein
LEQLVRSDELIDNVARGMTTVATRPALRERVVTAIAAAPQGPQHGWLIPAMAGAAGVAIVTWMLMPARLADEGAVVTTAQHEFATEVPHTAAADPVIGRMAEAVVSAPVEIARSTSTGSSARSAATLPIAAGTVWPDTPVAEIPMLPPLAGPPPIVIEPIGWDEVMLAPVSVALIEVKALAIEPLDISALSGV